MTEESAKGMVEANECIQLFKALRSVLVTHLIGAVDVDGKIVDDSTLAEVLRIDRSGRQCQERLVFERS